MASTNVWPGVAQMVEDVGISAAGVFEGVGKDGEASGVKCPCRKGTLLVCCLCQSLHNGRSATRIDGDTAEWITGDTAKEAVRAWLRFRTHEASGH